MTMTHRPIRVLQVGLGPIGQQVAAYAADRKGVEVVGGVDPAPGKVGQDLGRLCNHDALSGRTVFRSVAEALQVARADVGLLTTVSGFPQAADQAAELLREGLHVVSSCEEMSYPWQRYRQGAQELDDIAQAAGRAVLSVGVNPGFLMDTLVVTFTGLCKDVQHVTVRRIQDASQRRIPFQEKIGAGLALSEFALRKDSGSLRHVGLTESMHMIAVALGWGIDRTEEVIEPVIAETEMLGGFRPIHPGLAAGVLQIGRAFCADREVIRLEFQAAVGQSDPVDEIIIDGTPRLCSRIPGGVNGDIATCALTVNAVCAILGAPPGLRTMLDMPTVCCFGQSS